MAKLSELKKVELLESAVLTGTIDEVIAIMEEYSPFEFTARALGYAARFRGADMVACLINYGATFSYHVTPEFVKKYEVKVSISNSYSYKVDYSLYLLKDQKIRPIPEGVNIISDNERARVLETLCSCESQISVNKEEILYYSILFGDFAIREKCRDLGICELTSYRTANICCDLNYSHMDGYDRHYRDEFTWALRESDTDGFKRILTDILHLLGEKKMKMMPADLFYDFFEKKEFYSAYCTEGLFELAMDRTNLLEKVKKWDMIYGFVDHNNTSGLSYALEQNWLSKPRDFSALLEYVQSKENLSPALIALVMQYAAQNTPTKAVKKKVNMNLDPMSPAALKKDWTFKEKEDGTLVITSYKGNAIDIIVPAEIGGKVVTEIGERAFSPLKSRITKPQAEHRTKIASVSVPDGVVKISDQAFCGCDSLRDIYVPETVTEIGFRAFSPNDYLGHATNLTIHGKAGSSVEEFAQMYYAKFVTE